MTKLADKIFTTDDILNLHPCSSQRPSIPDNWSGTLIDILESSKTHYQKLWVVLRLVPRDVVEVFAIDCGLIAAAYAADAYGAAAYAAEAAYDADVAAAYAAASAAADAADAADAYGAAERERQIDALIWLIENYEKGGEA